MLITDVNVLDVLAKPEFAKYHKNGKEIIKSIEDLLVQYGSASECVKFAKVVEELGMDVSRLQQKVMESKDILSCVQFASVIK